MTQPSPPAGAGALSLWGSWHGAGEPSTVVLHQEGCRRSPAAIPPAPWECAPRVPLQTPREPSSSNARRPDKQSCPQEEGPLASSARPCPEPASCPNASEMGTIRSSLYLLRPSLQLLPLLHAELPHTGQQVMRGDEDPGAQEKREDVCPLKTRDGESDKGVRPGWPQGWRGQPFHLTQPPPQTQITCTAQLTLNALPPPSSLLPNPAHQARHRGNPTWQQLSATSLDELSSQCSYSAGRLPYPLPDPTLGTKPKRACWGDPPGLGGPAAQATVLSGPGAKLALW